VLLAVALEQLPKCVGCGEQFRVGCLEVADHEAYGLATACDCQPGEG
jgi:hypothetical protein